jgi:hypothetical protein
VPADGAAASDCWTVVLGNCYNQECCVLAGYQNGDLKMFDLKAASVRWEANVGEGVCGVQVRRQGGRDCTRLLASQARQARKEPSSKAFSRHMRCLSLLPERTSGPAAACAPPAAPAV